MSSKKMLEICERYISLSDSYFKEDYESRSTSNRYKSTQRWSLPVGLIPSVKDLFSESKIKISWGKSLYPCDYTGGRNSIFEKKEICEGTILNPPFFVMNLHFTFLFCLARETRSILGIISPKRSNEEWYRIARKNCCILNFKNRLSFLRMGNSTSGLANEASQIIFLGLPPKTIVVDNDSTGLFIPKMDQKALICDLVKGSFSYSETSSKHVIPAINDTNKIRQEIIERLDLSNEEEDFTSILRNYKNLNFEGKQAYEKLSSFDDIRHFEGDKILDPAHRCRMNSHLLLKCEKKSYKRKRMSFKEIWQNVLVKSYPETNRKKIVIWPKNAKRSCSFCKKDGHNLQQCFFYPNIPRQFQPKDFYTKALVKYTAALSTPDWDYSYDRDLDIVKFMTSDLQKIQDTNSLFWNSFKSKTGLVKMQDNFIYSKIPLAAGFWYAMGTQKGILLHMIAGFKFGFTTEPPYTEISDERKWSSEERKAYEEHVVKQIKEGKLGIAPEGFPKRIVPSFVIKQANKYRLITNAVGLNPYIPICNFKLVTTKLIKSVLNFEMDKNIYHHMTLDCRSAYFLMNLDPEDARYVCISYTDRKGKRWILYPKGYPFGIRDACYKFQNWLNEVVKFISRWVPYSAQYLDDILMRLRQTSKSDLVKQRDCILQLFDNLNIFINKKSQINPTRRFTFIGNLFNDEIKQIRPKKSRLLKILDEIPSDLSERPMKLRKLHSIVGQMISMNASLDNVQALSKGITSYLAKELAACSGDYPTYFKKEVILPEEVIWCMMKFISTLDKHLKLGSAKIGKGTPAFLVCDTGDSWSGGYIYMTDYISKLFTVPLSSHEKQLSSTFRELTGILKLLTKHKENLRLRKENISYLTIVCDNTGVITGLISKSSKHQESRILISKIHDALSNLNIFVSYLWARRDSVAVKLADALTRPWVIGTGKFTQKFKHFINQRFGKILPMLFSFTQLKNISTFEHYCVFGCNCSKTAKAKLPQYAFLGKESMIITPKSPLLIDNIINFIKSRRMKGLLITPFYFNSPFYQRLKGLKGVCGPEVWRKQELYTNCLRSRHDQRISLFTFDFS